MERLLAASHARDCSVFAAMKHTDVLEEFQARTREAIGAFSALLEKYHAKLHEGQTMSLQWWAGALMDEVAYYADLKRSEKNPEAGESRVRNVKDLIGTLEASAVKPVESLQDFLDELMLDSSREEDEKDARRYCHANHRA